MPDIKRSVSTSGLLVSAVIAALIVTVSVFGIGASAESAKQGNHYIIDMTDYKYSPAKMTWRVGDTVTLTIRNVSQSIPGKVHEFMMGRNPNTEETVFGKKYTDGFEIPFFKGTDIEIVDGRRMMMVMQGESRLSGMDPKKTLLPDGMFMQMSEDFMVVFAPPGKGTPGSSMTIRFKVPDKPGNWEIGCFQETAQHYPNGMNGTVTIVER